jgi:hypothetical protein
MWAMDGLHFVPAGLARRTEMTIEEIYHESIKPLAPSERFRLATLILSEIPPQSVVDIRDAWNEEDMQDISTYSARLFTAEFPEEDGLVDTR